MNKTQFSIHYEGPALSEHEMDVRELSTALLALHDFLEEAQKVALPGSPELRLHIKGGFQSGSFVVDLVAAQSFISTTVDLFSGKSANAIVNLLTLTGFVGGAGATGLIALIRWLRGRKPDGIVQNGENLTFECVENGTVERFESRQEVLLLFQSQKVLSALSNTLKPLEREGVDRFASSQNGETQTVIGKEEWRWFVQAALGADTEETCTTRKNCLLRVETVAFQKGHKWRFSDGGASFYAQITDSEFVARIESGERFGAKDVLRTDLLCIQSMTDNGLKTRYEITAVHEHMTLPDQDALF